VPKSARRCQSSVDSFKVLDLAGDCLLVEGAGEAAKIVQDVQNPTGSGARSVPGWVGAGVVPVWCRCGAGVVPVRCQ
jgi:hypothetical protein